MSEIFTIDLQGRVSKRTQAGSSIEFIQAQMLQGRRSPFALVLYKKNGIAPPYGLRLDLQKKSFLDHFEDSDLEAANREAAVEISEIVGQQLQS